MTCTFRSPVPFDEAYCQTLSPNRLILHGPGQDGDHPEPDDRIDFRVGWNHETEIVSGVHGILFGLNAVAPVNKTVAHKSSLRLPALHFEMLKNEVSWIPLASSPMKLGWNAVLGNGILRRTPCGDTAEWCLDSAPLPCFDSYHSVLVSRRV